MRPALRYRRGRDAAIECLIEPLVPLGRLPDMTGQMGGQETVSHNAGRPSRPRDPTPGSVLMFAAEDDAADTIRPRLEAAGARDPRVHGRWRLD